MPDKPRNMGASVRARLLNIARQRHLDNNLLLTRYALERLLYRLSTTAHRDRLARAIAATFIRRNTPIPTELPDALTAAFAQDVSKQRQWSAFLHGIEVAAVPLADITSAIRDFIMPHVAAARGSRA